MLDLKRASWVLVAAALVAPVAYSQTDGETDTPSSPAFPYFTASDVDGDDALSIEEFSSFIDALTEIDFGRSKMISRRNAYERAFGSLDEDGNGLVSWDEFLARQ